MNYGCSRDMRSKSKPEQFRHLAASPVFEGFSQMIAPSPYNLFVFEALRGEVGSGTWWLIEPSKLTKPSRNSTCCFAQSLMVYTVLRPGKLKENSTSRKGRSVWQDLGEQAKGLGSTRLKTGRPFLRRIHFNGSACFLVLDFQTSDVLTCWSCKIGRHRNMKRYPLPSCLPHIA